MAITEESLIELAVLVKGGHDKEMIDERDKEKFIEAVKEKEEGEDSPPVNGAEVMCVYAEDQTKPVKVKKSKGNITIGGKVQLNSRDIELEGTFSGCITAETCGICKEWIEEGRWQDVFDGNDQGEGKETLTWWRSYMICTEWGGLIYLCNDGQPLFLTSGDKILYLSPAFLEWLEIAEGFVPFPFRDRNDNKKAQGKKTVTIGIGFSFNDNEETWGLLKEILGWTDDDIRKLIESIYNYKNEALKEEANRIVLEDPKYKITKKQAKKLLLTAAQRTYMPQLNKTIEEYNRQQGKVTTYPQRKLEAMFDVSYNQGLSPAKVNDPDSIIPYYLTRDCPGAVEAVTKYGNDWSRRRLNQMNLFFHNYDFEKYNDGAAEFAPLREKLGFS